MYKINNPQTIYLYIENAVTLITNKNYPPYNVFLYKSDILFTHS